MITEPASAAWADLCDRVGMARGVPSQQQIRARLIQAEAIRANLPVVLCPAPATVAELAWIQLHAQRRGLGSALALPTSAADEEMSTILTGPGVPAAVIDPCGQGDLKHRLNPVDVLKRRFLKITDMTTGEASYQSMAVVATPPAGGVAFPGGEWLGRIDACDQVVDFAQRFTVRPRQEVSARNRRANANLDDQLHQREGQNVPGGSESQLGRAATALAEYQAIIDSDELEVEVQSTTVFAVGSDNAAQTQDAMTQLVAYFAGMQFKLLVDPSAQESLWAAMLPGEPTTTVVRELAQIQPSFDAAAAVPLVTTELGDRKGSLLGLETSCPLPMAVLLDLLGAGTMSETALAVACIGELGAGKSVTMKTIALDQLDRGSTLVAIDHTAMGEWGLAVSEVAGSVVVEVSEHAHVSIDPLRIFPPAAASRVAQSFLTPLLNLSPTAELGQVLSDVLEPAYLRAHGLTSLGGLLAHLQDGCTLPDAGRLASAMRVFAGKDFGRAVFAADLPALDVANSPAIVFWSHLLQLPTATELNNAHLFEQMSLEKRFGRAAYVLFTAIARQRCFTNRHRLDLFACDEVHHITISPEGVEILRDWVRDGRKHLAALILGGHDAEADFGDVVLRSLIPVRILLRHRDATLAARGLRWFFGQKPESDVDPDLLKMVTTDLSPVIEGVGVLPERRGEALVRDFQARCGRIKVLQPARPARADTVLTTPTASDGSVVAA